MNAVIVLAHNPSDNTSVLYQGIPLTLLGVLCGAQHIVAKLKSQQNYLEQWISKAILHQTTNNSSEEQPQVKQ